jgi:hypothetical protein
MPGNDDETTTVSSTWSATTMGPDGVEDPDAVEGIEAVLGFELPPPVERRRRSRVNIATAGLAVIVLAAGAFYAGVSVEKSHAKSSTSGNLAAAFSRFAGARGGAGGTRGTGATGATGTGTGTAAGGAAGAGVTVGQVKLVDGKNVYVTDTSGGITKVVTNSSSTITVTQSGSVSEVKPGDTVIVRGAVGADGSVTATSLTDSGAGGAAGGFGGFGGSGTGGTGGTGG